jgi:hypothetical protein
MAGVNFLAQNGDELFGDVMRRSVAYAIVTLVWPHHVCGSKKCSVFSFIFFEAGCQNGAVIYGDFETEFGRQQQHRGGAIRVTVNGQGQSVLQDRMLVGVALHGHLKETPTIQRWQYNCRPNAVEN